MVRGALGAAQVQRARWDAVRGSRDGHSVMQVAWDESVGSVQHSLTGAYGRHGAHSGKGVSLWCRWI